MVGAKKTLAQNRIEKYQTVMGVICPGRSVPSFIPLPEVSFSLIFVDPREHFLSFFNS